MVKMNRLMKFFKREITLYQLISKSTTMKKIWDVKNTSEIGMLPMGFIISKITLFSSLVIIWVNWQKIMEKPIILLYAILGFIILYIVGLVWMKGGFFIGERKSETNLDPIAKEMYEAAKKINKRYEE